MPQRRGVWRELRPWGREMREIREEGRILYWRKWSVKRNRIVTGEVHNRSAKEANGWLRQFGTETIQLQLQSSSICVQLSRWRAPSHAGTIFASPISKPSMMGDGTQRALGKEALPLAGSSSSLMSKSDVWTTWNSSVKPKNVCGGNTNGIGRY